MAIPVVVPVATRLEFQLLGPLQVLIDGAPVVLRGAGERALLALLLLDAGRVVPADHLIDNLWREALPHNALNAVQGRVSRLRQALRKVGLPDALVVSRRPGYLIEVDPATVDVHRFVHLVEHARRCAPQDPAAEAMFAEALGLWQGPALAEFDTEPWARDQRQRLEEMRLTAIEEWLEVRLAGG